MGYAGAGGGQAFDGHLDVRVKEPAPGMVVRAPDFALGGHTASLGLVFYPSTGNFPQHFHNGAFIGQHGSWNRKSPSGYKVVFVSFGQDGMPTPNVPEDFLTGFIDDAEMVTVFGRPVCVAIDSDGSSLLISDDTGGSIWRVTYEGEKIQK